MSHITKLISRIGTCRSGMEFDVPHVLQSSEIPGERRKIGVWGESLV